jgi:protein-S-isoprenylcysteine O-methyltransferase Ste14
MMVRIGNFLFHYRNGIFPVVYAILLLPSRAFLASYELALGLGVLVAATGQILRAITIGLEYIVRGGRKRQVYANHLVQGGMFAHCRNPLYVGNYLILLGVGVAANSLLFLCTAIPFLTFAYWAIIAAEENYLRQKFSSEFDSYCKRVNRVVPRWKGFGQTIRGMRFNWQRIITKEYGSAFIWPTAIILVTLKNLWLSGEYALSRWDVRFLWGLLLLILLAFLTARVLKKKRWINDGGSTKDVSTHVLAWIVRVLHLLNYHEKQPSKDSRSNTMYFAICACRRAGNVLSYKPCG